MMFSGTTMANLLGVPAGAAIGNAFGWRATFWAVAAIAIVAAVAMAFLLPPSRSDPGDRKAIGQELRALNHQQVYLTYLLIILLITGSVALSTYIVPLLTDVAGVPLSQTPWFLLLLGAGSLIGNFVGGRLADWKLMPTLIAILACQAVLQLASRLHFAFGDPDRHQPLFHRRSRIFLRRTRDDASPRGCQGCSQSRFDPQQHRIQSGHRLRRLARWLSAQRGAGL